MQTLKPDSHCVSNAMQIVCNATPSHSHIACNAAYHPLAMRELEIASIFPIWYISNRMIINNITPLSSIPFILQPWQLSWSKMRNYHISSNSSHPLNRLRPQIDHAGCVSASEIQHTLELSVQHNQLKRNNHVVDDDEDPFMGIDELIDHARTIRGNTVIDLVKMYPCLYDTKTADFWINLKKENGWKAISTALAIPGEPLLVWMMTCTIFSTYFFKCSFNSSEMTCGCTCRNTGSHQDAFRLLVNAILPVYALFESYFLPRNILVDVFVVFCYRLARESSGDVCYRQQPSHLHFYLRT